MRIISRSIIALFFAAAFSQASFAQTVPSRDVQIKLALLAAPKDMADSASVLGYNDKHELTELRTGTNDLICLADDPAVPGLNVACYQKDLDPFMARGRELRAEGKNMEEIMQIREKEVESGVLKMPKNPTTLYVYSAKPDDYNQTTGEVENGYLRSVVYIPYATAESTGLSTKPGAPGIPWLMDAGTHRAHIMINPPVQKSDEKK